MIARAIRGPGRPLRFLLLVVGGWTGARVALLWPGAGVPVMAPPGVAPARVGSAGHVPSPLNPLLAAGTLAASELPLVRSVVPGASPIRRPVVDRSATSSPARRVEDGGIVAGIASGSAATTPAVAPSVTQDAAQPVATALPTRPRWSASAWGVIRGTGDAGGVATPQLGGSQIGARVAYRLDEAGRVAAVARVAAALGMRQQEAAVGVEWQPTRAPIRLVAEQRIGIADIRGGPALGLVGGVSARPIGAGLRVDGYAQTGVIARDRADGYVDGAVTVGRTAAVRGGTRLELGVGAWGAAQRGAARLDLGPSAVVVLPVDGRGIRIGVQWRERVAGNARPGSGAVLSLGADF